MIWFKFKGHKSSEYGYLESLPLDLRAEKTTSIVEVPGNVPVVFETGGFKSQKLNLSLGLNDISSENLDNIAAWLDGEGKLVFSNDPDRYFKAVCNGSYLGKRIINRLGKIPISFDVLPYRYQDDDTLIELEIVEIGEEHGVDTSVLEFDQTALDIMPVIKLYGNGELGIYNYQTGVSIKARNIVDYCIIDVPMGTIYDKDYNIVLNETSGAVSRFTFDPDYINLRVDDTVTGIELLSTTARWL